jgi:SPP1 gp7 family putative phage head morphogenesis protein
MAGDWTTLPYDEALAELRDRRPMGDDEFKTIELEVGELAFVLARVTKMDMLQWLLEKLDSWFAAGRTLPEFDAHVDEILTEAITDAHIEQMVRLSMQYQYGAGQVQAGTDPDLADEFWGWEYETQHDDRVRHAHRLLDGRRFASDDAAAFAVFPPWEFGCRCGVTWLLKTEIPEGAASSQIPTDVRLALASTDYASPALGIPYKPDLTGFDPRLIEAYANDNAEVN